MMSGLDPEELRDARQALLALFDLAAQAQRPDAARPEGYYRCLVCGGTGPWPSQIEHHKQPGGGPPVPCRVERGRRAHRRIVALLAEVECRPGDSPIIEGGA